MRIARVWKRATESVFSIGVVAFAISGWKPAAAATDRIRITMSLEGSIQSIGRNDERRIMTIAIRLHNAGARTISLALGGPAPAAIDNIGVKYTVTSLSGLARCSTWGVIADCIGQPRVSSTTLPLQAFTDVEPGSDAFASFELYGNDRSSATEATFAASLLYRQIRDDEDSISDSSKRRLLKLISFSFPPTHILSRR